MLSEILDGSLSSLILFIVSVEIFLFIEVSFSSLLTAVNAKGKRFSSFSNISFWYSNEHEINFSSSLKSTILTLFIPSTKTLTVPSGSFNNCRIFLSN